MKILMVKKMFVFVVIMAMCGGTQKLLCAEKKEVIDFEKLIVLENNFNDMIYKFPTQDNRLKAIAGDDTVKQQKIVNHAQGVQPLIDPKVFGFIHDVFLYKQKNGSDLEKGLYANMSFSNFVLRLYKDRPLTNYTPSEKYLLQEKNGNGLNSSDIVGRSDFDTYNTSGRYTTRDERMLAGLIGISSEVSFINPGSRRNEGKAAGKGSFMEEGVYAGLVGACFEQKWSIAYQLILRDRLQITDATMKQLWFKLLNIDKEESNEIIQNALSENDTRRYVEVYVENQQTGQGEKCTFDKCIYKRYMELVLRPFFVDGNNRAQKTSQKAYFHIIGLGAGAWGVKNSNRTDSCMQDQCIIDVCLKIIEDRDFSDISDLDFSWLNEGVYNIRGKNFEWEGRKSTKFFNEEITLNKNKKIRVRISRRDPAELLVGEDKNKFLVAMYAWDHGSLPGNEYWMGNLNMSGDPAAICCSSAAQMHTPHMNSFFEENIKTFVEENQKKLEEQQRIEDEKERRENLQIINDRQELAHKIQQNLDNVTNDIGGTDTKTKTSEYEKRTETKSKQDNRWMITKFLTYLKIGPMPVIPVVGMATIFAVICYFCAVHGIGTGMVFGH